MTLPTRALGRSGLEITVLEDRLELRLIVDALDDKHQFQLQSGERRVE